MGGVRVVSRTDPMLMPFGQVLVGGMDAMMWGNLGLRLGADYRRIFSSDSGENEFRLVADLVIPLNK